MKKLGLIGGTGPESTIEYYRAIEYGVQKKSGKLPELVIESLSVFDVLEFCRKKDYDGLTEYLLKGVRNLAAAGADFACFTGITVHIVYDQVAASSPIPIVSMIDVSAQETERRGYTKVGLLGTYPTMTGSFFRKPFLEHGIEAGSPAEPEMRYIGEKIEKELEYGRVVPATRERLIRIGNRMISEEKVQAIILGCTELPMILDASSFSVPVLDVMKIHIQKLIEAISG